MTYRKNQLLPPGQPEKSLAVVIGNDTDPDLVPFDSGCPWCGAMGEYGARHRTLVRERRWSFLFWRSHPAYFKIRCHCCDSDFRELTIKH